MNNCPPSVPSQRQVLGISGYRGRALGSHPSIYGIAPDPPPPQPCPCAAPTSPPGTVVGDNISEGDNGAARPPSHCGCCLLTPSTALGIPIQSWGGLLVELELGGGLPQGRFRLKPCREKARPKLLQALQRGRDTVPSSCPGDATQSGSHIATPSACAFGMLGRGHTYPSQVGVSSN